MNAWQYDKYITLAHFYRPVAWKAGGWTFAVYSHYNRGHFYNDRPKVYVTYKGGNSHKHDRFYADRHMAQNTNRGNGGHFLRPDGSKQPEVERHRPCPLI